MVGDSSRTLFVLIVGLVLVTVPQVATAYHLSVGATDAVGFGDRESAEDPSVQEDDWRRGVGSGCEPAAPASGEPSLGEVQNALLGDHFCESLRYHNELPEGLPAQFYEDADLQQRVEDEWGQRAPQDQAFTRSFVYEGGQVLSDLSFDVQAASYVGTYGLQTCESFCTVPYEHLESVGDPVQPDDPETVCEQEEEADPYGECGRVMVGPHVAVPNAALWAQQRADGLSEEEWEMNGWLVPTYDQTFVAFLEDDGEPVSGDELASIVEEMQTQAGVLDAEAIPEVCGFVDGYDVSWAKNEDEQDAEGEPGVEPRGDPPCPVPFAFAPDKGPGDGPESYDDRCQGALYACSQNPNQDPAWHARWVCPAAPGEQAALDAYNEHPANPTGDFPGNLGRTLYAHDRASWETCQDAFDSTGEYVSWHFVVAPTISDCGGLQNPGFLTSHASGGVQRFLAYDLDVYSPAGSLVGGAGGGAEEWSTATSDHVDEQARSAQTPVRKDARVEPNHDGSQAAWLGLEDTSQRDLQIDRELPLCNLIGDEEESVADPWVNVLDTEVRPRSLENRDGTGTQDSFLDSVHGGADPAYGVGAYGTGEDHQDRSNRPGPAYMRVSGHIGMYFDEDDDGRFGPILDLDARTDGELLHEQGVWPMQWGQGGETGLFRAALADLGFGNRTTGLVQALYLQEPTELVYRPGTKNAVLNYTEGNNVYLFFSNGLLETLEEGDAFVEGLVGDLVEPFVQEHRADVHVPRYDWDEQRELVHRNETNVSIAVPDPLSEGDRYVNQSDYSLSLSEVPRDFEADNTRDLSGAPEQRFWNLWSFRHNCAEETGIEEIDRGLACGGDTIVTAYAYEVISEDGSLGGEGLPVFRPGLGDAVGYDDAEPFDFCQGQTPPCTNVWFDVDPLDNDPDRNLEADWSPLRHSPSFS